MNDQPDDYELDFDEDEVLTRWGKMKQWWDIGSAGVTAVKYAMIGFKLLFVGSTAAVVVGQATNSNPLNEAAVEVGLVDPSKKDIVGNDAMYDELSNLIEDVERLEDEVASLDHIHAPPLEGERGKDGPPGVEGPQGMIGDKGRPGQDGKDGRDGRDGVDGLAATAIVQEKFDSHVDLLH